MNKNLTYILIAIAALLFVLALVWYFFFSIYEIKTNVTPNKIEVNSTDRIIVKVIAINLLGKEVPFRKTPFKFKFIENGDIVEARYDKFENLLFITSKNKTGKVKIQIVDSTRKCDS